MISFRTNVRMANHEECIHTMTRNRNKTILPSAYINFKSKKLILCMGGIYGISVLYEKWSQLQWVQYFGFKTHA